MSDSIVPESRIFRIGRECYVVYLGNERDDIRPFLRIGNTREIPEEVHKAVSTTVISDDHVGNPLLEILNVPKFDGRYLGDTTVVGEMRRFFKSFDLPTDEVTDYRKVKDGEKRHMVWFYSSGNIHLRYDDTVIFDLDRREKEDGHFVRLYEKAKSEFLRNPLRYIRQDFSGTGVMMAGGNGFWYESGDLLSFSAGPGFVARLMSHGVDPDFIAAMAYDLTPDELDSHEAAVYIGYVKRTRQRRKQLRVITSEPQLQRKVKLLFPGRGDVPATLDVADVSGKRKATFRESIVSRRDGQWMVHRSGLPEVKIGETSEHGIAVDIPSNRLVVHGVDETATFAIPEGFPVEFIGHGAPEAQMLEKYGTYVLNHVKDHLNDEENQLSVVLEKYAKMLRDDVVAGKSGVSPLLKQTAAAVKDSLKRTTSNDGSPAWFLFSNMHALIDRTVASLEDGQPLRRSAEPILTGLASLLSRSPGPDPVMPFWGDLYLGERPVLFWRATKRGFSSSDIATSREVNQKIAEIASLNETPWHDDLERLLRLIRSLEGGGQGPLTDEQRALLEKPEEPKPERPAPKESEGSVQPGDSGERGDSPAPAAAAASGAGATPSKRAGSTGRSRSRKWWWLLLLLLLLLGGLVLWDLSDRAPWGRVLPGGVVEPESTGTDAEPGADETGSGESGSDETPDEGSVGEDAAGETGVADSVEDAGDGTDAPDAAADTADAEAAVPVDTDVAPRTMAEVEAYLDVNGRVAITEADIHLAANEIAVLNGYKDLDYRVFTGADPDWIYPGNSLALPDDGNYVIERGDTIWFLAAREVRRNVERDLGVFDQAVSILEDAQSDEESRSRAVADLESIAAESRAAALRSMARRAIERR